MANLLDKIAAAQDRNTEIVHIPEWDVTVHVQAPSMEERSALVAEAQKDADSDEGLTGPRFNQMQFRILRACVFDPEDGTPVFGSADAAEILYRKNGRVVWELFLACQKLSGLSGDTETDEQELPTTGELDQGKD